MLLLANYSLYDDWVAGFWLYLMPLMLFNILKVGLHNTTIINSMAAHAHCITNVFLYLFKQKK